MMEILLNNTPGKNKRHKDMMPISISLKKMWHEKDAGKKLSKKENLTKNGTSDKFELHPEYNENEKHKEKYV